MHAERGAWDVRYSVICAVLSFALILGGQAIADASQPQTDSAEITDSVGRAGFAFLSGFRTYAAAVLWNRLEPIMHGYIGEEGGLSSQRFMVPTISMVVTLDPGFIDAYYVGSWIVAGNDQYADGIELLRTGIEANPDSGLLRVSYAQALETWGEDMDAAYEQAVIAMGPDTEWRTDIERHDSYAIIGSIMKLHGDDERYELVMEEIERLDEVIGDDLPEGSHDHDGDGVPDH